ncbi:MAG: HAD-IA family hydrolase [Candidatus Omnitrophica bacterium]|nr:HAD-IA family hydrolase [Candidatus Omnitrophota bacterium]
MIKLLIYDLDGTLIDSRRDIANAVNWALKELGLKEIQMEKIISFVGRGVTDLMRNVLTETLGGEGSAGATHASPLLRRSIKLYRGRYAEHLLDETQLFPSVRAVLEHFKGRKQGVITNKPAGFSQEILLRLGVEAYFFRMIGGDQEFAKKPSPEPVFEMMKSAQVSSDETVLIGDSTIDIETARNAKVKVIAAAYGFENKAGLENLRPDFMVNDFSELIQCPLLG